MANASSSPACLSSRSIAYGIARACRREGAELAFSYQGERFKRPRRRIRRRVRLVSIDLRLRRRRRRDRSPRCSPSLDRRRGRPSTGFVHSIGYAPKESIAGDFLEGFSREALPDRPRHLELQLPGDGQGGGAAPRARSRPAHPHLSGVDAQRSPTTTRWASRRPRSRPSVRYLAASLGPKGVRVNGISAGPIKTLAASGIKGFGKILDVVAENAPLAPQRDDRRRRQRRRVPALRPGLRRYFRDRLCRRRLQSLDARSSLRPPAAGAPSACAPPSRREGMGREQSCSLEA